MRYILAALGLPVLTISLLHASTVPFTKGTDISSRYIDASSGANIGVNIAAAIKDLGPAGGVVHIPAGTFNAVTTGFVINQPNISIQGTGSGATIINYNGTGDFIRVQMKPFTILQAGKISGLTINGSASGQSGIHIGDTIGMLLDDIVVSNFNGTPTADRPNVGSGIWFDNVTGWTERTLLTRVHVNYNTKDFRWTMNGGTDSFGYTRLLDVRCNAGNRNFPSQVCFSFEAGFLYHSTIIATVNIANAQSVVLRTSNRNTNLQFNFYDITAECTDCKGGTLLDVDAGTKIEGVGIISGQLLNNRINGIVQIETSYVSGLPTYTANGPLLAAGSGGASGPVVALQPDIGGAENYLSGLGNNLYWNGSSWQLNGDGVHNGGFAILGNGGDAEMKFLVFPSTSGAPEQISTNRLQRYQIMALSPTDLAVTKGIAGDGGGLKHKRFPSRLGGNCPTAAAVGAACISANLTWNSPFADNNYTVTCAIESSMGRPHVSSIGKLPAGAGVRVIIVADTPEPADGGLDCIAIHD